MQNRIQQIIVLLIGFISFTNISKGADQYFSSFKKGTQISNGTVFELRDDYWQNISIGGWNSDFAHGEVKNRIKLHFTGQKNTNHSTDVTNKDWQVVVNFDYTYWNDALGATTVTNQTLTITNEPLNATSKVSDYIEFTGGHRVRVTINSVTLTDLASVPLDVYLEQEMEVERYFIYDFTDIPTLATDGYSIGNNQVTLYWNYIYGAEEYDLEWCHVTDYTIDAVNYVDLEDSRFTRVTLSDHKYTLNLAHDDGIIYFRIRAVGRHGSNYEDRLEGDWIVDPITINVDNLMTSVSDDIKNWTYQAYYAEEGKRKEVLSVFDGSGRNRQAVTLNNSDNKALIAETFYDHEGRAIISTLPAPDDNDMYNHQLRFYEGFSLTNVSPTPTLFRKRYYDKDDNTSACLPESDVMMSNTSGSSYYYSNQNTEMQNTGAGDYIAEANLFPFTRTIMGRDGRVKFQSGVGDAHAIGNTHEQRYFYASPNQEKLDRLFGNHAGFSNHYQVTLVEDANGQVSMSYTNLAGQVVATSLIGENPESLVALESKGTPTTFTSSFNNDNNFIESDEAWVIGKNILVESAGEHDFEYTLEGEQFNGMCGSLNGDCVYDLTIRIWNECEELMEDENGILQTVSITPDQVFTETFILDYGDLTNDPTLSFTVDFPSIGTYYLEKRLTLNDAAFESAVNAFTEHMMDQELNECFDYDQLDVNYDGCLSCVDYCTLYPDLCNVNNCPEQVSNETLAAQSCDYLYNILVADMSPGGQYFDNLPSGDLTADNGWFNSNIATGTFWDDFETYAVGTCSTLVDFSSSGPNRTWANLRLNWDDCFAAFIVQFHPEFCHVLTCIELKDNGISEFMYDMMSVVDYTTATGEGWLGGSPNGKDLVTSIDPLVAYSVAESIVPTFEDYMTDNTTYPAVMTDGFSGSSTLWAEAVAAVNTAYPACTSAVCNDQYWLAFRSMYLSARHSYINQYIDCNFLCDADVIPDNIADNCSIPDATPTEAIGFEIRYPFIDYTEYDSSGEQDDFEEAAEESELGCVSTLTVDFTSFEFTCDYPTHAPFFAFGSVITSVTAISGTVPGCIGDLYPTCEEVAEAAAIMINDYHSVPEFTALADGCILHLYVSDPLGTLNGKNIYYTKYPDYHQTLGQLTTTCITEENLPNCYCTDLNLNYQIYSELYGTDEDIFTAIAADMNGTYALSPTVDWEDVQEWFENCESENTPCLLGVSCSLPDAVLADNCDPVEPECSPDEESENISDYFSWQIYLDQVNAKVQEFKDAYIQKCLHGANYSEDFTVEGLDHEYHYTLYFYDQAGNLTTTVPPAGMNLITGAQLTAVNEHRINPTDYTKPFVHTSHIMQSGYRYNSYNLVLDQYMPDAENTAGMEILNDPGYDTEFTSGELVGKIHMFNESNGVGIVYDGSVSYLYLTMDGGKNWTEKTGGNTFAGPIYDIVFTNSGTGYVIGSTGSGIILKYTTDYVHDLTDVETWNTMTITGTVPGTVLNDIEFIDATTGYTVGNNGTFIKINGTANTGNVITLTGTPTNNLICITKNGNDPATAKAYIGGSSSFMRELTGLNGTPSSTSPNFSVPTTPSVLGVRNIEIVSNDHFVIGGSYTNDGKIFVSDNLNPSTAIFTEVFATNTAEDEPINDILIQSSGVGYAVSNKADYSTGSIFVTTDFGNSWIEKSPSGLAGNYYISTTPSGQPIISGNEIVMLLNAGQYSQRFFYDDLGRIKASQDARQANYTTPGYSYSVYDGQGRVKESGEVYDAADPIRSELNDTTWPVSFISTANRHQVTYVKYDESETGIPAHFSNTYQENLRSRVASTWYKNVSTDANYLSATHYSYDIHGNVKEMLQENTLMDNWEQDFKRIEYDYDLISGNVNEVVYQRDEFDEFYHKYRYDADNRLIRVETSSDGNIWNRDAKYYYYLHGPLARTETGEKMVQGTDYAYTIHGWLKGVNSNSLRVDTKTDMGKDAHDGSTTTALYYSSNGWDNNNIHRHVAQDAYGFSLGYYNDGTFSDYKAIGAHGEDFVTDINDISTGVTGAGNNLYNGNIRHMGVDLMDLNSAYIKGMAYVYQYDQLNRLSNMNAWDAGTTGNFNSSANNDDYHETYSYDANGNITKLLRNGYYNASPASPLDMDSLTYKYISGTNKLKRVDDLISATNYVGTDFDDQVGVNYTYDEMGNLITDEQEEIESISWNARGKITRITREAGSDKYDLEFIYDPSGQRIGKIVKPKDGSGNVKPQVDWVYTWYVRDAQGNTMAVYDQIYAPAFGDPGDYNTTITLAEQTIYGSSRLGLLQQDIDKQTTFTATTAFNVYGEEVFLSLSDIDTPSYTASHLQNGAGFQLLGLKRYELTNHLGNVLEVVSDRKIGQLNTTYELAASGAYIFNNQASEFIFVGSGGTHNIDASPTPEDNIYDVYLPEVMSYSDYYPYHMQMPNRHSGSYRYLGANGQESETEITGDNSHSSAEYWMYDNRLGRRWNVDPVVKYHESPYAAFAGNPLFFMDSKGDDVHVNLGRKANKQLVADLRKTTGLDVKRNFLTGKLKVKGSSTPTPARISNNTAEFSATAETRLLALINNPIDFRIDKADKGELSNADQTIYLTGAGTMYMNSRINTAQVDQLTKNSTQLYTTGGKSVNATGYGMVFFHETDHLFSLSPEESAADADCSVTTGTASDFTNKILGELGMATRGNYGLRVDNIVYMLYRKGTETDGQFYNRITVLINENRPTGPYTFFEFNEDYLDPSKTKHASDNQSALDGKTNYSKSTDE